MNCDEYLWWRIHEVESEQVLHSQTLQQQHSIGQVRSLYLRHRRRQQFVLVLPLCVEAEGLPGPRPAGSPGALSCVSLADWVNLEEIVPC